MLLCYALFDMIVLERIIIIQQKCFPMGEIKNIWYVDGWLNKYVIWNDLAEKRFIYVRPFIGTATIYEPIYNEHCVDSYLL